ncbi:40-residue YVTN family beta-propeller repeat-containing protein [Bryocella elongata]|uniref:40-residue YVTN family beta-propeller repeat-containing protein n=2 Tax=Bryocella elongata TaxID=863522 RepID=A0A1H5UJD6_9BACT|nr:40-residue YVTN family beta-propeller repeat-containing protein [Bryocella elongata]
MAIAPLFVLAGSIARAATPQRSLLLVANQGDASLSLVDPATNMQIVALPEGVPKMFGHEVATSPDGHFAYLPLYSDVGVGKVGTDGNVILIVDLAQQKIADRIVFDHAVRPHCVLWEPHTGLLYVTTELDKAVTIIDPRTKKIVGSIPTGEEQSHMLVLSHDGKRGYTANVGSGTVSVLDLENRKLITRIPISTNTQRISITPDDRWVFTSDQVTPRLAVIDSRTNAIARWVDLPTPGYGGTVTRDGKLLLLTLMTGNQLAVIYLKTWKVLRTIPVGPKPQEVLVRPDGKLAYVSCEASHIVNVIDTASWKMVATINVGEKADGMAWAGN